MLQHVVVVLLLFEILTAPVWSQQENQVWFFGDGVGIDFRSTPPRVDTTFAISQLEGTAVACDERTGDLLFYTNGVVVADRTHRIMPNGRGLYGHNSSVQSAVVIRDPSLPSRYYIFTADQEGNEGSQTHGVNYSVVDLNMNGGLGDVVVKNVSLLANASERLCGIRMCGSDDYWIVAHERGGNKFNAWRVSNSGVGGAVVSAAGSPLPAGYTLGVIGVSHNAGRLVLTARTSPRVELFDFDTATGVVTGGTIIYSGAGEGMPYDAAFSPDDSKLYFGAGDALYQCSAYGDAASIAASIVRVNTNPGLDTRRKIFGIAEGPDRRIYVIQNDIYSGASLPPWLGCIVDPDSAASQCRFVDSAIIVGGRRLQLGLPNVVLQPTECVAPSALIDLETTTLCAGSCVYATDSSVGAINEWTWIAAGSQQAMFAGQSPPSFCYDSVGQYHITLIVDGPGGSDTAHALITVTDCSVEFVSEPRCPGTIDRVRIPVVPLRFPDTIRSATVSGPAAPRIDLDSTAGALIGTTDTVWIGATLTWGNPGVDTAFVWVSTGSGTIYRILVTVRSRTAGQPWPLIATIRATSAHASIGDGVQVEISYEANAPNLQDSFSIELRYDSTVLLPHLPIIQTAFDGTLLAGWRVLTSKYPGTLLLVCYRDGAPPLALRGLMCRIPFFTFLGSDWSPHSMLTIVRPTLLGVDGSCFEARSEPGAVTIDAVCGQSIRPIDTDVQGLLFSGAVPNPMSRVATFSFNLSSAARVRLEVVDPSGQAIDRVLDGECPSGTTLIQWSADDVAPGMYFARLRADDWIVVQPFLITR